MSLEKKQALAQLLYQKTAIKNDVQIQLGNVFESLNGVLNNLVLDIVSQLSTQPSESIVTASRSKGDNELMLTLGEDTLLFYKHHHVYTFDSSNPILSSTYVKADNSRALVGMISVYNVVSDYIHSKYINNAYGTLIARIFINKELKCTVESTKQIGMFSPNFEISLGEKENLEDLVLRLTKFCLDQDIEMPKFNQMQSVSVEDLLQLGAHNMSASNKKLGFVISEKIGENNQQKNQPPLAELK